MQKLLLSLLVNRPNIDLVYGTGFRVFDYKSFRLCDRAIREGCFGRHPKASYVAYGALFDDTDEAAGPRVRTQVPVDAAVTKDNVDVYVAGIGTSAYRVGFSFDFDVNEFVPWPQGKVPVSDMLKWQRFTEALGLGGLDNSDVVIKDGYFGLTNRGLTLAFHTKAWNSFRRYVK